MRKEMQNKEIKQRKLDFSGCEYYSQIHELIRQEFELPDWYGENLSALWDSVTGIMYTPAEITVSRKVKRKEFQEEIDGIIEVLIEAKEKYYAIIVHVTD